MNPNSEDNAKVVNAKNTTNEKSTGELMVDSLARQFEEENKRKLKGSSATRLQRILNLINDFENAPKHHRYSLVSAITLFAGTNGDAELEACCEAVLNEIRSETD